MDPSRRRSELPARPPHRRALTVPLVVGLALALFAAGMAGEGGETATAGGDGPSLESVLAEPEKWVGETIAVTGAVEERYEDRAFSLGYRDTVTDVIVLPTGELAEGRWSWPTGDVTVTGKARRIDGDDADVLRGDIEVRMGGVLIEATSIE